MKLQCYLFAAVILAARCLPAQSVKVTAVEGESWLNHLSRSFNETSMGKTGRLGPPPSLTSEDAPRLQPSCFLLSKSETVTLHGADLYRLNCQGCHGESGAGAPPEINSVINPVRATSPALVMARMKSVGMDMSPATAVQLAQQARAALQLRLHQGGENMPPFPHLDETEIHALLAYLKQLAGFPGAEHEQMTVKESRLRVGEHIVKSTCHTCHGAAGPNPNAKQLLEGAIPPLSTLTTRTTMAELVRKVTQGAPIVMGEPAIACRGRMPVFGYLTAAEAEDVYLYLESYPPSQAGTTTLAASATAPDSFGGSAASNSNQNALGSSRRTKAAVISLAKFAGFPAVLFLFFGVVLVKGLPLAMQAHPPSDRAATAAVRMKLLTPTPKHSWHGTKEQHTALEEQHEHSSL